MTLFEVIMVVMGAVYMVLWICGIVSVNAHLVNVISSIRVMTNDLAAVRSNTYETKWGVDTIRELIHQGVPTFKMKKNNKEEKYV